MTDDVTRVRLDISYDGTGFSGWAWQPGRRTVAGELTQALATLLRTAPRLIVAGRTDAGVHASGQVAHVDIPDDRLLALASRRQPTPQDPERDPADDRDVACLGLLRRLAGLLPPDVRVRRVGPAAAGFDARFSALRRHYRYRIGTAHWGIEPADRGFVLAVRGPLDVPAMGRAAAALIGLQDFAAFCKPRDGASTIRDLQRLQVGRIGDEVDVEVTADAFCHCMVRSLVGALLRVGQGRADVDHPAALLRTGRRTAAIHVAPAHGLTLLGVDYPHDEELAARADQTRAVRAPAPPR